MPRWTVCPLPRQDAEKYTYGRRRQGCDLLITGLMLQDGLGTELTRIFEENQKGAKSLLVTGSASELAPGQAPNFISRSRSTWKFLWPQYQRPWPTHRPPRPKHKNSKTSPQALTGRIGTSAIPPLFHALVFAYLKFTVNLTGSDAVTRSPFTIALTAAW